MPDYTIAETCWPNNVCQHVEVEDVRFQILCVAAYGNHPRHGVNGVENDIHVLLVTDLLDGGFGDVEGAIVVRVIPFVDL